jgi:SUF system FeS assembly protein, NifU family
MSLMEQIYKTVILERSRHPRHHGALPDPATQHEGVNPSCGDELRLSLLTGEDGTITDARFQGHGCAISQASADLMIDAILGKTHAQARDLAHNFKSMIRGEAHDTDQLGELRALSGVKQLHARVKCATLPWTTLEAALAGQDEPASDER